MLYENQFQAQLIKEIKNTFKGCIVLKNDPDYMQGFPDLTILHKDKWATLECKRSERSPHQPNQDHYVEKTDEMSFSRFIYPENKKDILNELKKHFT